MSVPTGITEAELDALVDRQLDEASWPRCESYLAEDEAMLDRLAQLSLEKSLVRAMHSQSAFAEIVALPGPSAAMLESSSRLQARLEHRLRSHLGDAPQRGRGSEPHLRAFGALATLGATRRLLPTRDPRLESSDVRGRAAAAREPSIARVTGLSSHDMDRRTARRSIPPRSTTEGEDGVSMVQIADAESHAGTSGEAVGRGDIRQGPRRTDPPDMLDGSRLHRMAPLKRLTDLLLSGLLLILLSPALALVAGLVVAGGRPVLYRQKRIGRHGVPFDCIKFRTMVPDADKVLRQLLDNDPTARVEWDAYVKLANDPRITPVGRFLRRTSLDELPQLWNVLRGDMSLVGPRPIAHYELHRWGEALPSYMAVRPGITGLWQLSGRNNANYGRRLRLSMFYLRKWSLALDLKILLRTLRVPFSGSGA